MTISGELSFALNRSHLISKGRVIATKGPVVTARLPLGAIGDVCEIVTKNGYTIQAQVVAFSDDLLYLAPFESTEGIYPGAQVINSGKSLKVRVGSSLLSRVIDPLGNPLDGKGAIEGGVFRSVYASSPSPLSRPPIRKVFQTGIRSVDSCCTLGIGQRVGLFASAGQGKSTLLGMIAKKSNADVVVVSLVGERGREVREFIDECLGPVGLKRSVVVVSTSDDSSIRRSIAPYTATTIAEYFRDQGKNVLLLVDSITRAARALREIGLASGEMPVRQGYTPSVYSELPKLLERAGTNQRGSITAIYTVLTAAENDIDPLGEEVKSILDGHIMLSSKVALSGIRPAIDLLNSTSRLYNHLMDKEAVEARDILLHALKRLRDDKDILLLGGNPDAELKNILDNEDRIKGFLNQGVDSKSDFKDTLEYFKKLCKSLSYKG